MNKTRAGYYPTVLIF